MGLKAQIGRPLILICLLALFGCTTPKPAPTTKPEPVAAAPTPPPVKQAPPSPVTTPLLVAPKPPPPARILTLSDGPWTECTADEATVAVVVTIRTNGLFRERAGVHYLHPAQKTIYRLVQLRSNTPVTVAQKEVPEACSAAFHLTNNEADPAGQNYSIHSTLKQIPVDSTHAITLNLRVNCRQNGNSDCIEESIVLNGLNRTEFVKGAILAAIEILTPDRAAQLLAKTAEPTAAINNTPSPTSSVAPSDWDLLHKKFQLTGQESRIAGWFQFSLDASIQFPDIRFASDLIEISEDHAQMKLRGPVRIEWDGRTMTSGDAVMRISANTIQFESSTIQTN